MKHKLITALIVLTMILFASCDYSSQSIYSPEIENIEIVEDAEIEIDTISFTAPWQEAYSHLLREYLERAVDYEAYIYPFGGWRPRDHQPGGNFILFDIDGDGIPELIVRDRFHFTTYFSAYTFSDGLVIPLESAYFYDYATMFFVPISGYGLGMESNEGVWNSASLLVIDECRLVPAVSLRRGEGSAYDSGAWETWWSVNDDKVTEEAYDEIYYRLFGGWDEREWIFSHENTLANIYSIILGFYR